MIQKKNHGGKNNVVFYYHYIFCLFICFVFFFIASASSKYACNCNCQCKQWRNKKIVKLKKNWEVTIVLFAHSVARNESSTIVIYQMNHLVV